MLALIALVLATASVDPCPSTQVVEVRPARWASAVRKAARKAVRDEPALVRLLDVLDLELPARCEGGPATGVDGVDLFTAALTSPRKADVVVQVRFPLCGLGTANATATGVQVLRPLGDGLYCKLGTDLSFNPEVGRGGDKGSSDGLEARKFRLPRLFAFRKILRPDQEVIEVDDWLPPRPTRFGPSLENRRALWAATPTGLRLILDLQTWAQNHELDAICVEERDLKQIGEAFPRTFRVVRSSRCTGQAGSSADGTTDDVLRYDAAAGAYEETQTS